MLALPEALIQLYCSIKLDLRYWDAPPLEDDALAQIRQLPQREKFEWPHSGAPLSLGHLIVIGWVRMTAAGFPENDRLFGVFGELDRLQQFYTQYRNPLAHRLTTIRDGHAAKYTKQCRDLLVRVSKILIPQIPVASLPLPTLAGLLDLGTQSEPETPRDGLESGNAGVIEAQKTLGLSYLLLSCRISGGMSGSSVHVVEFREGPTGRLNLGILKTTKKREDFDRERTGFERAKSCWLGAHIAGHFRSVRANQIGFILSPLAFPAVTERRIDSFYDLLVKGEMQRCKLIARRIGQIYSSVVGGLVGSSNIRHGTARQHLNSVWLQWREAALGFDWTRWGFPAKGEQSFADGERNWINPLAALEIIDCWKQESVISLAWGWQHRDLNPRNILISPFQAESNRSAFEIRFVDLEKVGESSAFTDLCWMSFWVLSARADEEVAVREDSWEEIPESFIDHSLGCLESSPALAQKDCGVFQMGLECVSEAFQTMRSEGHKIGDPVVLYEMAALTMTATALAKSFYELRDIQRSIEPGTKALVTRWQKARCYFRIAARAIERFVVRPSGPFVTDLSGAPSGLG
jgi:hypothetical protein